MISTVRQENAHFEFMSQSVCGIIRFLSIFQSAGDFENDSLGETMNSGIVARLRLSDSERGATRLYSPLAKISPIPADILETDNRAPVLGETNHRTCD
jgi:hypothetical protein